jgi:hypothetical protein
MRIQQMARPRFVILSALWLVLLAGVVLIEPPLAVGQNVIVQGTIKPIDPKSKDKKAPSVEAMTFPSDRDAKNMIQAVKDYIKEFEGKPDKAPWDRVCQAAQQVLDAKSDSFFELAKTEKDATQGRVSAKAEINRLIGQFPTAGRQFYQLTFGPQAEAMLANAKDAGYDKAILSEVSQRYYHTKAGAQATLLLAAVNIDRGNYIEAAYHFERLLARPESDDLWTPGVLVKTIVALKRSGSANGSLLASLNEKLEKKFPREGLTIGRRQYSLDELKAEIDRPYESLLGKVSESFVSMRYGNAAHTGLGDGGKPFLDPNWSLSLFQRRADGSIQDGYTWMQQNLEDVLRGNPAKPDVVLPGFFPTTANGTILYRGYDGLYATTTRDGVNLGGIPMQTSQLSWFSVAEGGLASLIARGNLDGYTKADIDNYWRYYRDQANLKSILYENPLVGSITHDGINAEQRIWHGRRGADQCPGRSGEDRRRGDESFVRPWQRAAGRRYRQREKSLGYRPELWCHTHRGRRREEHQYPADHAKQLFPRAAVAAQRQALCPL